MKKLLLLMLVLCTGVGMVSAELKTATIYVKASSAPKIHIWDCGTGGTKTEWGTNGEKLPTMESTTLHGVSVYKCDVSYESAYSFLFKYVDGNQSGSGITVSSGGDVYYSWDGTASDPTFLGAHWVVAGSRSITANYEEWNGTSTNNRMTSTDDETFTITVTDRPLKAGVSYQYKVAGDGSAWYPGSNNTLTVDADGLYDITYTYTRTGNVVSAETSNYRASTVSYKYYIYDNDAASWDGITAITGKNWTACEMTNVDGTYVYGISSKSLTSGNKYGARFIESVYVSGSKVQDNFFWISDDAGGSQGCRYYDCTSDGTYNIVFSYNPSEVNYAITSAQPKLSVTSGYYAATSDDWTSGSAMTFDASNGVYKYNFENIKGKYFVLSSNSNVDSDWDSYAIRPESGSSGSYDVNSFNIFTGTGVTGSGNNKTWLLPGDKDIESVEITFRPTDYHWEVTPYITGSISTAGYATYSHGSAYKITGDGVGVYTITATAAGEANMSATDWNDAALPAGTGVVLTGSTSSATPYTVTPSDGSASIGTNLLVGSGDDEITLTASDDYTNYILANKTNGVKFYKWDESTADNHNKVAAHKAYLQVPTGAGAPQFFNFNFGGETTGVEKAVKREERRDKSCFNLAGQRVAQPSKGLYIVNGKKVVIK